MSSLVGPDEDNPLGKPDVPQDVQDLSLIHISEPTRPY